MGNLIIKTISFVLNKNNSLQKSVSERPKNFTLNKKISLQTAVSNKDIDSVKILLDNGANVSVKFNNGDNLLMYIACKYSDGDQKLYDIAELLIKKYKIAIDENTFKISCKDKTKNTFTKLLIDNAIRVLDFFIIACEQNNNEIIEYLCEHKINVNGMYKISGKDYTLLSIAVQYDSGVEELLKYGANINYICNDNMTPLMYASKFGKINNIITLLKNNASVNLNNRFGINALMFACRFGHYDVVKVLLDSNALVNSIDNKGYTPLMFSCIYNNYDVACLLLEYGADISIINKDKISAKDYIDITHENYIKCDKLINAFNKISISFIKLKCVYCCKFSDVNILTYINSECLICMENTNKQYVFKCGHINYCEKCFYYIKNKNKN